jgi:hypothetical protein
MIPDVISLNLDLARKRIYTAQPEAIIMIVETADRMRARFLNYSIAETVVIRQKNNGLIVELTVAYTTLQL